MKQTIRKIIAMLLIISLTFSAVTVAGAAVVAPTLQTNQYNTYTDALVSSVTLDTSDDNIQNFTYVDFENGDALIEQYNGSELFSRAFVDRSENTYTTEMYSNGNLVSTTTETVVPTKITDPVLFARTTLGRLLFDYDDGLKSGIYTTRIDYEKHSGIISHNIRDNFQSMANFASFLATAFGWTAGLAGEVAKVITKAFGIVTSASFVIPNCDVECKYEEYVYYTTDSASGKTGSFSGIKYVVIDKTSSKFNSTHYDGNYFYPSTTWSNKDMQFATYVYQSLYPAYIWSVRQWL